MDSVEDREDLVFAHDEVLLTVDLDFLAGILAEEDGVARLHVQRLPRAVARSLAAGPRRRGDAREVPRSLPASHRTRPVMAMREQLERLIDEMVTKGVRYDDAQREFEKKFIAQVLVQAEGNLGRAADLLGMHRNTLSRKMSEYRLKRNGN